MPYPIHAPIIGDAARDRGRGRPGSAPVAVVARQALGCERRVSGPTSDANPRAGPWSETEKADLEGSMFDASPRTSAPLR